MAQQPEIFSAPSPQVVSRAISKAVEVLRTELGLSAFSSQAMEALQRYSGKEKDSFTIPISLTLIYDPHSNSEVEITFGTAASSTRRFFDTHTESERG